MDGVTDSKDVLSSGKLMDRNAKDGVSETTERRLNWTDTALNCSHFLSNWVNKSPSGWNFSSMREQKLKHSWI